MNHETINELAAALVAFQGDLVPVGKDAANPFFKSKYASLQSVMTAVQPLLKKHKLAVSQFVSMSGDGSSALRTILMHASGQALEDTMPLLLPKSDPQGQGSAITYARRYSIMAVLGVVADEDDDANRATKAAEKDKRGLSDSPTQQQLRMIYSLAAGLGYDKADTEARVKALTTKQEASAAIEKLQAITDAT